MLSAAYLTVLDLRVAFSDPGRHNLVAIIVIATVSEIPQIPA